MCQDFYGNIEDFLEDEGDSEVNLRMMMMMMMMMVNWQIPTTTKSHHDDDDDEFRYKQFRQKSKFHKISSNS